MLAVPLTDYYEEVRRYLTCPEAVKDDLLFDVNRQVMDLNADLPDSDYDDLVEFLGEPEDLARQFMDSLGLDSSPNHQEEKLRPHLVHRIFAIALVAALSVTFICLACFKSSVQIVRNDTPITYYYMTAEK